MKNRKVLFVAHDPGGLDVTRPVAERMLGSEENCEFHCIGTAAKLCPQYASSEEMVLNQITKDSSIAVFVCGTSWGNDFELRAIKECRNRRIHTVVLLDFWANYANRFQTADGEVIYPDHFAVMDRLAFREAVAEGVPADMLRVLGQPGLDRWVHFGQKQTHPEYISHLRILFLSQPLSTNYGDTLGYTEQTVIEDLLQVKREDLGDQFAVKFHPKDSNSFRNSYAEYEVEGELSEIFLSFNVVIGMSTMGLLHAALFGKSVLSYQPGLLLEDMSITNKLGITLPLNSFMQMDNSLAILREAAKNGKRLANQPINKVELIWMDGNSTQRVLDFVKGLA